MIFGRKYMLVLIIFIVISVLFVLWCMLNVASKCDEFLEIDSEE